MDLPRLPNEVWSKIFHYLPYRDLNSVTLVCRRFRYLAEDPLLWRGFHFQINSKVCHHSEHCLHSIRRLSNVSHILVWGYGLDENQIECVFDSLRRKKSVSHVRFTSINLSKIDETILSGFVSRLTAVILDLNYLTLAQTKAIFEKLTEGSKLKHLDVSYNAMLGVPASALTSSLGTLQSLRLIQVQISDSQLETLMVGLTGRHSLHTLELHGLSLDNLEPQLFASALSHVNTVIVHNTFGYSVTKDQLARLFIQVSQEKQNKLRNFHLILGDLVDISLLVLDSFLLSDVDVRLSDCSLSEIQFQYFRHKERINISTNFDSFESSVNLTNYVD